MADDKKGAAPAASADGADGKKKKSNLVIVIGIVVLIEALLVAAVTFLIVLPGIREAQRTPDEIAEKKKADSLKQEAAKATTVGAFTDPIEITVNIAGTDDHFLKTAIIFEYDEKNDKLGAELTKRAPTMYKDMMIKHMSSLSLTEITDPSERDKISKDLQRMVNASLPETLGKILSVRFTNYITQ